MMRRQREPAAETLRLGQDRLRLRPWAGDAGTGLLILLTPGAAVSDATTSAAIEAATGRGYNRLRTSALSGIESEPFIRAGFEPCQVLALLSRPIANGLPRTSSSVAIRKARRRDHSSVLAVDHAAFELFWHLDQAGLHDALQATPFRRFRVAHHEAETGLVGYAISGRGGPAGYLQRLAISPRQQGQGVGAALVVDGLRWMARWGATQAWVNTPQHNTGALRLYERLGFEQVSPGLQVLELDLGQ